MCKMPPFILLEAEDFENAEEIRDTGDREKELIRTGPTHGEWNDRSIEQLKKRLTVMRRKKKVHGISMSQEYGINLLELAEGKTLTPMDRHQGEACRSHYQQTQAASLKFGAPPSGSLNGTYGLAPFGVQCSLKSS